MLRAFLFIVTYLNIFALLMFCTCFPVGEYDALPEQAFYMVGPIEDVVAKAAKMAEELS